MKSVRLLPGQLAELEDIYAGLEKEYQRVAGELGFSCTGCPDNCCDSYFLHHTYVEWAYLWLGLLALSTSRQEELRARAEEYLRVCARATARGERPQVMCPLNTGGLCQLYRHRLLVCRTHGVPATIRRPDGQVIRFPGCFRCQEMVSRQNGDTPQVERTLLLGRLARLENELLQQKRHLLPRVKMTIAEMVVKGPPMIPVCCGEEERC
ncbi:MAG: hypothetical protein V2I32_08280 [Desulforhopalus sp.]|jgi:hypothetical protein|nr:hypothetical protein [Desulforhopalus sp.]